jgi:hypothetical protein
MRACDALNVLYRAAQRLRGTDVASDDARAAITLS